MKTIAGIGKKSKEQLKTIFHAWKSEQLIAVY